MNRVPHFDLPQSPESRREIRRRTAFGLAGVILMLALVTLANLLTGQARQEAEVAKAQAQAAGVANPGNGPAAVPSSTEPLGDVPAAVVGPKRSGALPATTPSTNEGRMVVPDLQPDPHLTVNSTRH